MSVLMEILEWFDETGEALLHRLPPEGSADIKFGAQLIVRESQEAVFFNGGVARDRFGPGRHTLSSKNLPLLTTALSLPWGFKSPFRCEVYFFNRKTFTNLKWGTLEPVVFRDERLGLVRLRAHGLVSFRISNPVLLQRNLAGMRASFTTEDVTDYLRSVIVARVTDYFGENLRTIFELPAIYDETGAALREKLDPDFAKYGLELVDFFLTSVTPPEEVQQIVDGTGGMRLLEDVPSYLTYQVARSLGRSAETMDGAGGARSLVEAGAGLGLGLLVPRVLGRQLEGTVGRSDAASSQAEAYCVRCGSDLKRGDRFCGRCGHAVGARVPAPDSEDPGPTAR